MLNRQFLIIIKGLTCVPDIENDVLRERSLRGNHAANSTATHGITGASDAPIIMRDIIKKTYPPYWTSGGVKIVHNAFIPTEVSKTNFPPKRKANIPLGNCNAMYPI